MYVANTATKTNRNFASSFLRVPFPTKFSFWSRNIRPLLYETYQIKQNVTNNFLCATIFEDFPRQFNEDAHYVFQSVAERVQEGDIEGITNITDEYATLMLKAWKKHCEAYDLVWEYTPNSVVSCRVISSAFLFRTNDTFPQIEWGSNVSTSSPSFAQYWNLYWDSKPSVEMINWVHITVDEKWILKKKDTGDVVFTSPEYHPNHHIWKFGRTFSKDPVKNTSWKIIDFNDCVRERIYNVLMKEQEHEYGKESSKKDVERDTQNEGFHLAFTTLFTNSERKQDKQKLPNARKLVDEWNLDTVAVWKHTCV